MASIGFPDIESERTAIRDNSGRAAAADLFRQFSTPTIAASVSAVADMYPNISPSVALTGVLSGLDPAADEWGDLDLEERRLREEEYGNYNTNPLSYVQDLVQGTFGLAVGAVRGGMVLFDTVWEEGVSHPLRTGVLDYQDEGFGAGQLSLGSAWQEASPSSGWRAGAEFFGDPMGNILSIAADYGNLFVPFADPFEVHTDSRVNLGSGFFANSDLVDPDDFRVRTLMRQGWSVEDATAAITSRSYGTPVTQLFREGAEAVRVTGRNGGVTGVSPGRLAMMQITEPGTQAFSLLSGTLDFGAQIALDPNNIGFAGLRFASRAGKGIKDFDDASGLVNGIRRTVFKQDADKALSSKVGRGAMKYLADTSDVALIDSILTPATRSGASNDLIRSIAAESNPDKVTQLVKGAVGTEIIRKPWKSSMFGAPFTGGNLRSMPRQALGMRESGLTVVGSRTRTRAAEIAIEHGVARDIETGLVSVRANEIIAGKMPDYGGFRPSLRQRRMDSSIIYDAATGRISRRSAGRNQRAISRLFSQMSGERIDISNLSNGRQQLQTFARALDLTPDETQKALARWVDLADDDINGAMGVMEGMMGSYRKKLYKAGVSEEVVNAMTTMYRNQDEMRRYFVDRAGDPQDPGVLTMLLGNGETVPVPMAHTLSEMSGSFISTPGDPRTIRRMTDFIKRSDGVLAELRGSPIGSAFYGKDFQSRVAVRAADGFMAAWKPMVLLRPAWTIRVVGEEQWRLASAGLHEFNSPIKSMAMALSNKNLKLGLTTRKSMLNTSVHGDSLAVAMEFQNAMSQRAGSWFDSPGGSGAERWIKKQITDADYDGWWFRELNQLQTDNVSNAIARSLVAEGDARGINAVKDSFFDGELAGFREELMGGGKSIRHRALSNRQGADAYIDSLNARIHTKAGGRYETLRDDGWWYDDMGNRVRAADAGDEGILRAASEWQPKGDAPGSRLSKGVRIQTRTIEEYRHALVRGGMPEKEVQRKLNYLSSKGAGNDAGFVRLDPDARTVLIPENLRSQDDILAEARTVQFRITEDGDQEILEAIATGRFGGVDFSGAVNSKINGQMKTALGRARSRGVKAPEFVKAVDEGDINGGKKALDLMFDTFMGKQTNRYSRSPAFTRTYWNTILDLEARGLIDGVTMDALRGMTRKSVWTPARNRKALVWSEKMDEHVSSTERLYGDLVDELDALPSGVADAIAPSVDRLDELLEAEIYDVGRYNRIINDLSEDLNQVDEALGASVKRALADESISEKETVKLVKQLEARRDEIGKRIDSIKREFDQDAIDDLDEMYGMMGGMPEGYIDGIDPGPNFNTGPSDLEDAVRAELRRQQPYGAEEIPADLDKQVETLAEGLARDDVAARAAVEADPTNIGSGRRPIAAEAGESQPLRDVGDSSAMLAEEEMITARVAKESLEGKSTDLPARTRIKAGEYSFKTDFGADIRIVKGDAGWGVTIPKQIGGSETVAHFDTLKEATEHARKTLADVPARVTDRATAAERGVSDAADLMHDAAITPKRVSFSEYEYENGDKILRIGKKWKVTSASENGTYKTLREAKEAYKTNHLEELASSRAKMQTEQERLTTLVQRRGAEATETRMGAPVGDLEKTGTGRYTVKTENGVFRIEKQGDKWYVVEPDTPRVEQLQVEGKRAANVDVDPELISPSVAKGRAAAATESKGERFVDAKSREGFRSAKAARESIKGRINPEVVPELPLDPEVLVKLKNEFGATDAEIADIVSRQVDGLANRQALEEERIVGERLQAALPGRPNQLQSIHEVDRIAKAQALTETQALLYDVGKRSNFSDMTRIIFPFAEAWWELASTWSRLIQAEPRTMRRFQQAYDGVKDDAQLPKGAFDIEGHDGQGFMYVDPRTQQEMFAIPYLSAMMQGNEIAGGVIGGLSGAAMGATLGGGFGRGIMGAVTGGVAGAAAGIGIASQDLVPEGENVDLAFNVQGMNMAASSVIPGLGPLMAVPISWVLSKGGKTTEPLLNAVLPFGEPNVNSLGDIVDSFLPSYVNKFIQAADKGTADQQRIRANTTIEVAGMMVRRGEGSFSSQEDIKKTLEDASTKSTWLYVIRGLAAFAGPTSPTFAYNTEDSNGNWFFTATMVNEWQKLKDEYGGDDVAAMDEFTGMFGTNPQTFMTGKTYKVTDAPLTENQYNWKQEHEEMFDRFPGTANLLNPSDPLNDEFDYDAYVASLREGSRRSFTPEQWAEKSNQLAANVVIERFRKSANAFLADSPNKAADQVKVNDQLYQLQIQLMQEYPGYNRQIAGVAQTMTPEQKINEVKNWTSSMKESELGKTIMTYMAARENAVAVGVRAGNSTTWWSTSTDPSAVQIRDELIAIATRLKIENPAFASAWASLFQGEIRAHLSERAPEGGA